MPVLSDILHVVMQNHDITEPDAQQTFRLMHYFAVEGREFPPGFPRVNTSHIHRCLELHVLRMMSHGSVTVPIINKHCHQSNRSLA